MNAESAAARSLLNSPTVGELKWPLSLHLLSHHELCCRDFVKISLFLSICHMGCDCQVAGDKQVNIGLMVFLCSKQM